MGMDAKCDIAYGFVVEEGELPWRCKEYDYDIDDWWRETQGYKPPFQLFDDEGNWLPGMEAEKAKQDEYYAHRHNWDDANPCPIGVITGSEGEEDAIITCAEIDDIGFDWDYGVQPVDPKSFEISFEQAAAIEKVRELLESLEIEIKQGPGWFAICDYS